MSDTPNLARPLGVVVEPDASLRALLRETLVEAGYAVLAADNGAGAQLLFSHSVALAVVAVSPRSKERLETILEILDLRRDHPAARVVALVEAGAAAPPGVHATLAKPFSVGEFIRIVHVQPRSNA